MRDPRYPYITGTVWDRFHHRAILTYVTGTKFCLLGTHGHIAGWPACAISFHHDKNSEFMWDISEIPEKLKELGFDKCLGFWKGTDYPEAAMPERGYEVDAGGVSPTGTDKATE